MKRVLTIGVYGWDAPSWIAALRSAGCDLVVDTRARRGVRGHQYAFANRVRLEALLAEAGIQYLYEPGLAPSAETRLAQTAADRDRGTRKRDRSELAEGFVYRYESEVEGFDWQAFADKLDARSPALLCVERVPAACHRSLAAARLAAATSATVVDLVP